MTRPFRIETAPTATGSALVGKLAIAQARIEQSFLDGGNVLIAVMEAVSGLTEILDGIVNLLEPRATSQVFDSMKTVVSDLAELPGIADRKQVALIEISHLCDSVYSRVEDMREIIRYLRTIAITVKITGASIPEFSGFADEIRERIQTVSEEINRFGDQLVAMRNRLGAANASSAGVIRDFASAIPQLVENMDRSSVALAEQQKRMAASASQLKQITGSIQGKIATILSALQIGDVTRQRIEHVMSMFEFFELFKASDDAKPLDDKTLAQLEAAISGLACAQLAESVDELNQKCASISANIASFTDDASRVLSLRDDLSGSSRPSDDNILEAMRTDLTQAADLSVKVGERTRELDCVVTSVGESTQTLISGIATIRKIKLDIFYMALNSNLACTRLGDAGRSVNVASGELRIFADKLESPAEGIVLQMQEIEAAKNLLTSDSAQRGKGIDEPLEMARFAVDKVADEMSVGLDALSAKGDAVFDCIAQAIRKLDFRSDLGDVLDDCLTIANIEGNDISGPMPAGCEAIDVLSARIFKTYTMVQERAIHQRFFAVTQTAATAETVVNDDDDLLSALF
jgi:methyl-accepting chemotaxis protein